MSINDASDAVKAAAASAADKVKEAAAAAPDVFADATEKVKDFGDKVKDAVAGPEALSKIEEVSDKIIDSVADVAKKLLPESQHETIDKVAENIDAALGDNNS